MEYYPAEKLIVACGATGGISPPWRSSFNLDACYYLDPGPFLSWKWINSMSCQLNYFVLSLCFMIFGYYDYSYTAEYYSGLNQNGNNEAFHLFHI